MCPRWANPIQVLSHVFAHINLQNTCCALGSVSAVDSVLYSAALSGKECESQSLAERGSQSSEKASSVSPSARHSSCRFMTWMNSCTVGKGGKLRMSAAIVVHLISIFFILFSVETTHQVCSGHGDVWHDLKWRQDKQEVGDGGSQSVLLDPGMVMGWVGRLNSLVAGRELGGWPSS